MAVQWKAVRFANAHLSDDKAVAKMGHPGWWGCCVGLFILEDDYDKLCRYVSAVGRAA
jgi:hypothetical protein